MKTEFLLAMLFTLSLPAVSPGNSRPQEGGDKYRLTAVSVVGSKRYAVPELARATGLEVSQNLTLDALKEAAGRLASTGVFAQVNYRYQTHGYEMTVVFTVQDAAGLLPCTFENFVWFSPQELLKELRARLPLFDGYAPPSGTMLDLVSAQLGSILEARGIHAQVQSSPQGAIGGPVQSMQFREIGVPIPVRKIAFTGAEKIDPALLQDAARPLLRTTISHTFAISPWAPSLRSIANEVICGPRSATPSRAC